MKTILKRVCILAITLVAQVTSADNFYLKGGVGLNTLNPFIINEEEFETKARLTQTFPLVELGGGYSFNDEFRVETAFDYYFMFNIKETFDHADIIADLTRKVKINAVFASAYYDIIKYKNVSIFLGSGIGCSFQKEKIETLIIAIDLHERSKRINKQINQLAYKVTLGADFKLNDNLNLETTYNYFDLGKSRNKYKYRLHNITLGLRYAI